MRVFEVVVVNGYGCNLNSPLRPYLDQIIAYLERNVVGCVVFCGGFTQRRSFPGMSEARVMADYIGEHVTDQLLVLVEENSYTTFENIRNSARATSGLQWEPDQITIFCEATRALKVALLARHFFGFPPARGKKPILIRTSSWELANPIKELKTTFLDWLCCHVPGLWRFFRWRRIRRAEQN